jgi:hypothetical protein
LEGFDLDLRFLQASLQGGTVSQRGSASAGPRLHAVLSNTVELHQSLVQPGCHTVGEQTVQERDVLDAEVGEGMVVRGHAAAPPWIGQAVAAEFVEAQTPIGVWSVHTISFSAFWFGCRAKK